MGGSITILYLPLPKFGTHVTSLNLLGTQEVHMNTGKEHLVAKCFESFPENLGFYLGYLYHRFLHS